MSIPVYKNERKNPMSGMTSGAEPRYKYTSPSIKPQYGKPPALGTDINQYNLTVCDVQTERRNFPGYGETEYFTLDQIRDGDYSGTTETDSATADEVAEMKRRKGYLAPTAGSQTGYTRINQKTGGTGRSWKTTSKRR